MKERNNPKFDLCVANFRKKDCLNLHVSTVPKGRKQFNCNIYNAEFI